MKLVSYLADSVSSLCSSLCSTRGLACGLASPISLLPNLLLLSVLLEAYFVRSDVHWPIPSKPVTRLPQWHRDRLGEVGSAAYTAGNLKNTVPD